MCEWLLILNLLSATLEKSPEIEFSPATFSTEQACEKAGHDWIEGFTSNRYLDKRYIAKFSCVSLQSETSW